MHQVWLRSDTTSLAALAAQVGHGFFMVSGNGTALDDCAAPEIGRALDVGAFGVWVQNCAKGVYHEKLNSLSPAETVSNRQ